MQLKNVRTIAVGILITLAGGCTVQMPTEPLTPTIPAEGILITPEGGKVIV